MNVKANDSSKTTAVIRRKGKVGRPKTLENPQMVSMRWGEETLKVARVLAARRKVSVSELVRSLVMDEARREAAKSKFKTMQA